MDTQKKPDRIVPSSVIVVGVLFILCAFSIALFPAASASGLESLNLLRPNYSQFSASSLATTIPPLEEPNFSPVRTPTATRTSTATPTAPRQYIPTAYPRFAARMTEVT